MSPIDYSAHMLCITLVGIEIRGVWMESGGVQEGLLS